MTFVRPELLALAPLAVLVVCLSVTAQWRRQLRIVDAYGGPEAAARLAGRPLQHFPVSRLIGLIVASVMLSVGAAGPERVQSLESERPIDVVVALDLSLSMLAEDVEGSRAARAASVVTRILETVPGDRVGVTVFADWPYTLVPMTDDPEVVRFFSASMNPSVVVERDQGTGIGEAVGLARRELSERRREEASGVIIVLSDGEAHGQTAAVLDSVATAVADGVTVWTAGVGTSAGASLPGGVDGEPLTTVTGGPVVARLDETSLRQIAEAGEGRYYDVSDERGARALLDDLADEAGAAEAGLQGPGLTFWLLLFGLVPVLLDGPLDIGRLPDPLRRLSEGQE